MNGDRLTRGDLRTLGAWALAAAVGIAVAINLFPLALPEVAVDMRVGPQDAARIARDFLRQQQGVSVDDAISTTVLDVDTDAQVYLQRELPDRANELIAGGIPVFAFQSRFVRDQQQEEWGVRVDPGGRVVGMTHVVEEARPSARLSRDEARAVAERWLRAVQPDLDRYAFLPDEARSVERPARVDWTFAWERSDLRAKDAPYRLSVTVVGDAVGTYEQGLEVPDSFHRRFAQLRSENFLYQGGAQLFYLLFLAAAVMTLVGFARRGAVHWRRTAVLLGVLALAFAAFGLNFLPLELSRYDTREAYGGYALQVAVVVVLSSLFLALLTALVWAAGEPLYRQLWPERLRLTSIWRPAALRSKETFNACAIGLAFAAAHLGFVVAFYVIGYRFGVWAPQDVRYSDVLTTPAPWIAAIGLGIMAATSEELVFRFFAIPYLIRLTRSRVVAVVVPAIVWSFLHSSYPFEPGYIRGLEIGIVGIVAGWVFLKWGILATLVWHYAYDAGLVGILLARAGEASFQVSGSIVAVAVVGPLVGVAIAYAVRRSFRTDPAVLGAAEPVPQAPLGAPVERVFASYAPASRRVLAAVLAAGIGGLATYALVHAPAIGSDVRSSITPDEAVLRADAIVRDRGLDPATYLRTATFGGYPAEMRLVPQETGADEDAAPAAPGPAVHEYLRRSVGIAETNELYAREAPLSFWRVRYVRDGEPEDHVVLLRPDGGLYAVWRRADEAAAGTSLSEDEAIAVAQRYLSEEHRVVLADWRMVESASMKLPARTDHRVVFERLTGPAEARVRAEVGITDGAAARYRSYVKIPEAWEREFTSRDLVATILGLVQLLAIAAAAGVAAILFFRQLRRARIPWRTLALIAAAVPLALVLSEANQGRSLVAGYTTDLPLTTYLGLFALSTLGGAALLYGVSLLVLGAGWHFASRAFGEERLLPSLDPLYLRDALVLGLGLAGTLLGLRRLDPMADALVPTDLASAPVSLPLGLDTYVPALDPLLGTVGLTLVVIAAGGVAAGLASRYLGPRLIAPVLLVAAVVISYEAGPYEAWAKGAVIQAVQLAAVALLATLAIRTNVLAYVLGALTVPLAGGIVAFAVQPHPFYQGNALLIALIVVLLYAVPAWRSRQTLLRAQIAPPAHAETGR